MTCIQDALDGSLAPEEAREMGGVGSMSPWKGNDVTRGNSILYTMF